MSSIRLSGMGFGEKKLQGSQTCATSLPSRHPGLKGSEITGHSNKRKNCKALKKGTQRVQIKNSNHKRLVTKEDRLVLTMSRGWCQTLSILMVWKKIKLHGTQTQGFQIIRLQSYWQRAVWKRIELQGSQTSKKSRSAVRKQNCMVLKQLVNLKYFEKIISNIQRFEGLEEGKITWCSNPWCCRHDIWREMELHDAQTGFRAGTRFGSGRNYRTLKYTREEAEKEAGFGRGRNCRTLKCRNMDCFWLKVANPQANDVAYNAEVKPHSQNQTKPRKVYGKSKTKLQGSQTSRKSRSVVRKQNYMMLKPCIRWKSRMYRFRRR